MYRPAKGPFVFTENTSDGKKKKATINPRTRDFTDDRRDRISRHLACFAHFVLRRDFREADDFTPAAHNGGFDRHSPVGTAFYRDLKSV